MLRSATRKTVVVVAAAILVLSVTRAGSLWSSITAPEPIVPTVTDLIVEDVTVINPLMDRTEHRTIWLHNSQIERITAYTSSAQSAAAPQFAGSFVLPGLIDMHVHHPIRRLSADVRYFDLLHLEYGVTSVRDCGSVDGSTLDLRSQIAEGDFPGPRIFACGRIIDGDPPFWPGASVARSYEDGAKLVDEFAAEGVDCIKVYSNLSKPALEGVRAAAHRHHLTLVGHVPISVSLEEAQLDDVQHLTGVPGPVADHPGLIEAVLDGWSTITDQRIYEVVHAALQQKTAHTPTIVVLDRLLQLQDYPELLRDPDALLLPRYYREVLWKPGRVPSWSVPKLDNATRAKIRQNIRSVVRKMHDAGVTLHVGTDTFNPFVVPGVSMHEEMKNFVESGFTPEQVWAAATRGNAAQLGERGLGTITEGSPADFVIFSQDPTKDLGALSSMTAVVVRGRLYKKSDLDAQARAYRSYFSGWLYDNFMMLVFKLFS